MAKYVMMCQKCKSTNLHMNNLESDLFIECLDCGELNEFDNIGVLEEKE